MCQLKNAWIFIEKSDLSNTQVYVQWESYRKLYAIYLLASWDFYKLIWSCSHLLSTIETQNVSIAIYQKMAFQV